MEMTNLQTTAKSFFKTKEGKIGQVFLWLIVIAGGIGLYTILPWIITLLTNTIHAIALIGVIALILFLVTNKQVQNMVSWGFKSIMRGLTGLFVELNKLNIMKLYIVSLEDNRDNMNNQIMKVDGQLKLLERKITDNTGQVEKSLQIASAAKEKGIQGKMWTEARKAERRRQSTIKLSDLLTKLKKIRSILAKMYDVSGYVIEDLKDYVEQAEIEYNTVKNAYGALQSSMSIINGDPDKRAMFEMALEKTEEETSQKLATMSRFMEVSESVVQGIDLEQNIFAEDGLVMLEEYENGGFDDFFKDFNPDKKVAGLIEESKTDYNPLKSTDKVAIKNKAFSKQETNETKYF